MAIWEDIEAVQASTLPEDEKKRQRHALKTAALADILNNGSPPIPKVVGQTFTFENLTVTLHAARDVEVNGARMLHLVLTVMRDGVRVISPTDDCFISNPPVIASGGRKDLIETAKEIIRNLALGR